MPGDGAEKMKSWKSCLVPMFSTTQLADLTPDITTPWISEYELAALAISLQFVLSAGILHFEVK